MSALMTTPVSRWPRRDWTPAEIAAARARLAAGQGLGDIAADFETTTADVDLMLWEMLGLPDDHPRVATPEPDAVADRPRGGRLRAFLGQVFR